MLQLTYKVDKAGWAFAAISNEEQSVEFAVSYLHDSLKELAESAIEIREKDQKTVVFMDEPGEHVLKLFREGEAEIAFELRWYKDWWSWGLEAENDFKVVLKGETTIAKYVNQVRNVLLQIHDELGPERYRGLWIEHDFPITELERLR